MNGNKCESSEAPGGECSPTCVYCNEDWDYSCCASLRARLAEAERERERADSTLVCLTEAEARVAALEAGMRDLLICARHTADTNAPLGAAVHDKACDSLARECDRLRALLSPPAPQPEPKSQQAFLDSLIRGEARASVALDGETHVVEEPKCECGSILCPTCRGGPHAV